MTRDFCLHILRNSWGYTQEEIKEAQLFACDEIEHLEKAYLNMRDWAEQNGVDTVCRNR
jgi:hypothetical protein